MERRYIESFFFLALLLGTLALAVVIILPFLKIVIMAAILAFLFSAPFAQVKRLVKSPSFAAFLVTIGILITILVPLVLVGYQLFQEATGLYSYLRGQADQETLGALVQTIQAWTARFLPNFQVEPESISSSVQQIISWIIGHTGSLFASFGRMIISFLFLLLFFFYLLRDGAKLKARLMELSPLPSDQEERILGRIGQAINGTVRGSILLAILQGLMAGTGFWLFGVPNPALWGSILIVTSFIPTIGTSLVQVPAITYLLVTGHLGAAIGLGIWALTAVGLLDNLLGPRLVSNGTHLHPLVTMLAVLGGLALLGPIGIILGPVTMALLFALFDIYLSFVQPKRRTKRAASSPAKATTSS